MGEHYVEQTVYSDPSEWGDGDAYGLYRFLTHALAKAGRYEWYARALESLRFEESSPEACAIARSVVAEMPGSERYLSMRSRDAIACAPLPVPPVVLRDGADETSPLAKYGVLL